MECRKLTWVFLFLAATGGAAASRAEVIEDASGSPKTITSIGDALNALDHHPVHVLYIHGIGQMSLIESPNAAHDDYAANKPVLRIMFKTSGRGGGE